MYILLHLIHNILALRLLLEHLCQLIVPDVDKILALLMSCLYQDRSIIFRRLPQLLATFFRLKKILELNFSTKVQYFSQFVSAVP